MNTHTMPKKWSRESFLGGALLVLAIAFTSTMVCLRPYYHDPPPLTTVLGVPPNRPKSLVQQSRTIELGLPFSFIGKKNGTFEKEFTITHAIRIGHGHEVAFLSPLRAHGPSREIARDEVFSLTNKYICVFETNFSKEVRTMLQIYRTSERDYTSCTVWKCDLPPGTVRAFSSVRLAVPNESSISGSGVFQLAAPSIPYADIISCTKLEISEPGDHMNRKLEQYLKHYRAIGVGLFIFYVNRDGPTAGILTTFKDVTVVRMGPKFQELVRGELNSEKKTLYLEIQKLVGTDCVWRTRYRSKWNMIMVDVDEYLLGTRDLLNTLENEGRGVASLSVRHRLVEAPFGEPFVQKQIRVTKEFAPTRGKSFVRPEEVDVMWVHGPTAFAPDSSRREKLLSNLSLLHFRTRHLSRFNLTSPDLFEPADLSSLPASIIY